MSSGMGEVPSLWLIVSCVTVIKHYGEPGRTQRILCQIDEQDVPSRLLQYV